MYTVFEDDTSIYTPCLILMKTALHLFHLQVRKFSMQILFGEHDVTGKIIFIIKPFR